MKNTRISTRCLLVCVLGSVGGCFAPEDVVLSTETDDATQTQTGDASSSASQTSTSGATSSPPTSGSTTSGSASTASPTDSAVTTSAESGSEAATNSEGTLGSDDTGFDATTESGDTSSGDTSTESGACVQDCSGIACGQDSVCGLDCPNQCGAAASCAEDQSYCALALGNPTFLGTDADVVGGIMFGHRVSIPNNTTLKALGVIAGEAGPNVQLAIFSDSNGPQTRMRQTGEFVLQNDNNEVSVPDTPLTAGDYWIMIHTEGLTSLGRTAAGDNDHEFAYVFTPYPGDGSASFPLNIDNDQIVADFRYNLYIIVEE